MPDNALEVVNQKIQEQLDRIYKLLDENKNANFLQVEYKRYVELATQKSLILPKHLEDTKTELETIDFETKKKALEDQYKEDVIAVAIAIDEHFEKNK